MELTINEKKIIFRIIVLIMKADLVIKDEEVQFLDKIFKDFNLTIEEFDHLEDLDLDYLKTQFATFDSNKKKYAKSIFEGMANCDGYIDPRESLILLQLC